MTRLYLTMILCGVLLLGCTRDPAETDGGKKVPKNVEEDTKKVAKEITKPAPFAPVTTVVRPNLASAKPDYAIDAKALKKEWQDDSKAARAKYEGAIIEISGYVDTVTSQSVVICASPTRYSVTEVANCIAPLDKLTRIHRLGNGQKVKVVAKGISMGIIMDLISVTELEPSNLVEITAENLAKEFEKAPEAAEEKYRQKDLAISGRIKELKKGERNHQVTLVGTPGTPIYMLAFEDFEKWDGKNNVEVRTSVASYIADRKYVGVYGFLMAPR